MPDSVVFQHQVRHSQRLALTLLVLHTVVAAVMLVTALPWPAKLAMLMLIVLSLAYYLARDVLLLLGDSWCDISFEPKVVSVVTRDGTAFRGQVANMTFVCPCFVVLCLKPEGKRMLVSRVIFPDSISAVGFREVRVHLRYT
jgi:toxin CptA